VLVTSMIAGTFAVLNMVCAFLFGGIVDRYRKKTAMVMSNFASLLAYAAGAGFYFTTPKETFADASSPELWILIFILIIGSIAGNLRTIALVTLVRGLFEKDRDKANGMIGAMSGLSFSVTSVLSGLAIGFYGMDLALWSALVATLLSLIHLILVEVHEPEVIHSEESKK